jgi:hypothetical protein
LPACREAAERAGKVKKKHRLAVNPTPENSYTNPVLITLIINLNPTSMEQMHPVQAKESIVMTCVTAFLYFCAIMLFAYVVTMS